MMEKVIELVLAEREVQKAKWGKQNLTYEQWLLVLTEEVGELAKEMMYPTKNQIDKARTSPNTGTGAGGRSDTERDLPGHARRLDVRG